MKLTPSLSVAITDLDLPDDGGAEQLLRDSGFRVLRGDCRTEDDIIELARDADALLVQWAPVSRRVLTNLRGCRFVSRLGIGYDMIDVDAATELGIAVANVPDYCIEEVAAHTLALIMTLTRGVLKLDQAVQAGRWSDVLAGESGIRKPSTTTVAVVGFGRIGSRVASVARGAGFCVAVYDPYVDPDVIRAAGCEPTVSLPALVSSADVVTLHTPLTPQTHHLMDGPMLSLMREDAYLINTCRGGLIDEAALTKALRYGRLSGAALDVFEHEPLPGDSQLRTFDSVIMTPHAAWYSPEALRELPRRAAIQIVDFFEARPVPNTLNPEFRTSALPVSE